MLPNQSATPDAQSPSAVPQEAANGRRSRAGRLWLLAAIALGLLLIPCVIYATVAYRYYLGEPRLTRNFAAELNAPVLRIPEADRAWPRYRIALERLNRRLPSDVYVSDEYINCGDRKRYVALAKFDQNLDVLPLVKAAASLPKLGYLLSDQRTDEDLAWLKNSRPNDSDLALKPASDNPMLWTVLLPPDDMELFVEMLCLDAEQAAALGDGARVVDDLSAAIGVAGHSREIPLLVSDVISWRMLRTVMAMLRWLVVEYPDLIDENGLDLLAERLANYCQGRPITPQLLGERMTFEDVMQRMYTDDGAGDGRLLAHNTKFSIDGIVETPAALWFRDDWQTRLIAPLASAQSLGRREVMQRCNRFMDETEAACSKPLWQFVGLPKRLEFEMPKLARNEFLRYLISNISVAYSSSQATAQEQGATLVAIALARHRMRHGAWPAALDELALNGLSEAIVDRFTGDPLKYQIVEMRPALYSLGPDRNDDGGRLAIGALDAQEVSTWLPVDDAAGSEDGDWILLPTAKPKDYERLSTIP